MQKKFKRLVCWWKGCDVPLDEEHFCDRCGRYAHDDDWLGMRGRIFYWWVYHRPQWLRPLDYFKRCPDCGKRFRKHGAECPPF